MKITRNNHRKQALYIHFSLILKAGVKPQRYSGGRQIA